MRQKIRKLEIAGAIFTVITGGMLHFTFEWTNYWMPVALIAAVNESTWEHLKLAFFPALLFCIPEYFFLKEKAGNFLEAKAASLYIMPATIVILFYSYTALLGENLLILDISIFVLAVIAGYIASYRVLVSNRNYPEFTKYVSFVALLVLTAAFMLLTYFPPHLPLFKDPVTGGYGIIR